jgi:hypothetical protein
LAKIFRIFKKIKSLSVCAAAIKIFGEKFIFPFTPLRFWQKLDLFSIFFGFFWEQVAEAGSELEISD